MTLRSREVATLAFILTFLLPAFPQSARKADAPKLGEQVPAFALKDTKGKSVALADFADKKAIVVVFIGTECPLNNAFMPQLAELERKYARRGAAFLAINANVQDTAAQVAEHARKHRLPFPVLKDEGNRVADQFAARRTPEAFVLDSERRIRYRGRIDDQFGIGYNRPKPTRRDLAIALGEVLAGKQVSVPVTEVEGCLIGRTPKARAKPDKPPTVTYARQISRILQKHCQECHRPGQIGPMALLTYDDAVAWSGTIREVVTDGRMPPWLADSKHGEFSNDRRLGKKEKQQLLKWIEEDTPRGDPKELPEPLRFNSGWRIGKPDLVVTMPKEYDVPAEMPRAGVPYQYFSIDPGFKEDRWVLKAEARPGAADVVHHVLVFIVPPGERFFPGSPKTPVLAGTAPGESALIAAPGTAKRIPAGSRLVFQMHYTPIGVARKDRSSLGLIFARKPPAHEVRTRPIYNLRLNIPPGDANYAVESWFTFRRAGHVTGLMPHMHLRGKDFLFEAHYPEGKKEVLLSVPRFDFNWQSGYRLAKPKAMPAGTKIRCLAHFDNSAANRNNPDPTKRVFWGDQTWQEMMIGWLDFYYDE